MKDIGYKISPSKRYPRSSKLHIEIVDWFTSTARPALLYSGGRVWLL